MPGGDGTGPRGLGPMTGRAAGFCAGYPVPGYMSPIPGRGWFGRGKGRGWGRGFGRGWGRGFGWGRAGMGFPAWGYGGYYGSPYGYPYDPEVTPQQEADMLKEESKALQEEIKSINDRIQALETATKGEKK